MSHSDPNEFLKNHTQSHANDAPNQSSEVSGSYTACCVMTSEGHHSLETVNHLEEMSMKETDETDFVQENVTDKEIGEQNEDEQTEAEVAEGLENMPVQNEHPMSSQRDAHLFNYFSKMDDSAAIKTMDHWECERSLPWSRTGERTQNLSVPMFLYLLNNDIKSKICDLDQKEREACRAHKWDEALRLRGMKNKLILTREHQLLNAVGLKLDERTRFQGMKSISERQDIILKREKLISDGNLYSEEAKELWKKWEAEDEKLEKNSAFVEREGLMQELEDEWKALADEDKDRIAQLYGKSKPDLLTEHHHKQTQNYPPY